MKNCVYRFLNKDNEIIYIGKAADLKFRIACHIHLSKKCYEEISRIEYTSFDNEYEMDLAERYFIPKIKPKYNKNMISRNIGLVISEFENRQWYEFKKGREHIEIEKTKNKGKRKGPKVKRVHSEETRRKISESNKGRKLTKEQIERLSGENCFFYGKKGSQSLSSKKICVTRNGECTIYGSIVEFCTEVQVPSSTFYDWINKGLSPRAIKIYGITEIKYIKQDETDITTDHTKENEEKIN